MVVLQLNFCWDGFCDQSPWQKRGEHGELSDAPWHLKLGWDSAGMNLGAAWSRNVGSVSAWEFGLGKAGADAVLWR